MQGIRNTLRAGLGLLLALGLGACQVGDLDPYGLEAPILRHIPTADTSVSLEWNAVEGADSYALYEVTPLPDAANRVERYAGTERSWTSNPRLPGAYRFVVQALSATRVSPDSPPLLVDFTPEPVGRFQALGATPSGINVNRGETIFTITFNQPVDQTTISPDTVVVSDNFSAGNFQAVGNSLILESMLTELPPGETFTVELFAPLAGLDGSVLDPSAAFSFTSQATPTPLPPLPDVWSFHADDGSALTAVARIDPDPTGIPAAFYIVGLNGKQMRLGFSSIATNPVTIQRVATTDPRALFGVHVDSGRAVAVGPQSLVLTGDADGIFTDISPTGHPGELFWTVTVIGDEIMVGSAAGPGLPGKILYRNGLGVWSEVLQPDFADPTPIWSMARAGLTSVAMGGHRGRFLVGNWGATPIEIVASGDCLGANAGRITYLRLFRDATMTLQLVAACDAGCVYYSQPDISSITSVLVSNTQSWNAAIPKGGAAADTELWLHGASGQITGFDIAAPTLTTNPTSFAPLGVFAADFYNNFSVAVGAGSLISARRVTTTALGTQQSPDPSPTTITEGGMLSGALEVFWSEFDNIAVVNSGSTANPNALLRIAPFDNLNQLTRVAASATDAISDAVFLQQSFSSSVLWAGSANGPRINRYSNVSQCTLDVPVGASVHGLAFRTQTNGFVVADSGEGMTLTVPPSGCDATQVDFGPAIADFPAQSQFEYITLWDVVGVSADQTSVVRANTQTGAFTDLLQLTGDDYVLKLAVVSSQVIAALVSNNATPTQSVRVTHNGGASWESYPLDTTEGQYSALDMPARDVWCVAGWSIACFNPVSDGVDLMTRHAGGRLTAIALNNRGCGVAAGDFGVVLAGQSTSLATPCF